MIQSAASKYFSFTLHGTTDKILPSQKYFCKRGVRGSFSLRRVPPVSCRFYMDSEFSGTTYAGNLCQYICHRCGESHRPCIQPIHPHENHGYADPWRGFAVMLIGLKMAWKEDNFIILICSLAFGGVIGELIRIEDRINGLGKWLEERFSRSGRSISKGFVTTTLLFCVGSMALVGSLESGLTGNHDTLFAKSVLDGLGSIIFSASLGIGVLFSAASVFFYQGCITMGASFLKQFLTGPVISQMSAVGGLLIVAMGFNMLDIVKIKVANLLPAIFLPLVYFMLVQLFRWVSS